MKISPASLILLAASMDVVGAFAPAANSNVRLQPLHSYLETLGDEPAASPDQQQQAFMQPVADQYASSAPVGGDPATSSRGDKFQYSPCTPIGDNTRGGQYGRLSGLAPGREYYGAAYDGSLPDGMSSTELTAAMSSSPHVDKGFSSDYYSPCTPVGDNTRSYAGSYNPAPKREYYGAADDGSRPEEVARTSLPPAYFEKGNGYNYYSPCTPLGDNTKWIGSGGYSKSAAPKREYFGAADDGSNAALREAAAASGGAAALPPSTAMTPYSSGPNPSGGYQPYYSASAPVGDNAPKEGRNTPAPGREYYGAAADSKYYNY